MGESYEDPYADARFTEEISTRMQVPDRIMVSGPATGGGGGGGGSSGVYARYNDLGMRQRDPRIDMQVPERIMIAGGNTHVFSKSTPRELQLENAMLPPTMEHIRVSTPPRSIRLDEHSFPTATDDESSSSATTFGAGDGLHRRQQQQHRQGRRRSSGDDTTADVSEFSNLKTESPMHNLTPLEEIQILRRQFAKLNHRLMAVELENQQQQQREMVLSVIVSVYFVAKLIVWLNRTL